MNVINGLLKKNAKDFFTEGFQPKMIALSGLRGVGKTTLIWQTRDYIYKSHTKKIFFISIYDLNNLYLVKLGIVIIKVPGK
jgi:predicted AAA+ superfamily ATPase